MMIKKVMILFFAVVTAYSCSKDDDSTDNSVRKYADQVILSKDETVMTTKIEYNSNMQVTAYVSNFDTIRFEYENGKVAKVKEGDGTDTYALQYTNGTLSGIDHYSMHYPVTYNSQDKSYTLEGGNLTFSLAGKDIFYVDDHQNYRETFSYDAAKKGAFYNLEGKDIFPFTLFANSHYYYLTAAAISSIKISETEICTAVNTYDEDGYIVSCSIQLDGKELFGVQYHYMEK